MNIDDIKSILKKNNTISVYQLAILDYLNTANNAEAIAGKEPSRGPIADDPTRKGRGYDIGITVANRIIERRRSLGGTFKSIHELADIPFFGKDKFQDLVYTFMKLRSPVPTGKGRGFDNYIIVLSRLEIAAFRMGITIKEFISLIRKLFYNKKLATENYEKSINLDWDLLVPDSIGLEIPSAWAGSSSMNEAMEFITRKSKVDIDGETINVHLLIAGLEAKLKSSRINTSHPKLELKSNVEFLGFMTKLMSTTYQTLADENIPAKGGYEVNQERILKTYGDEVTETDFNTIADIFNIKLDPKRSLTWNLLNYYTDTESPSKRRFTNLASDLGLGEYENGLLTKDNKKLRDKWVVKLINGTFFLLTLNGKRNLVTRMMNDPKNDASYIAYRIILAFILDLFFDRLVLLIGMEKDKPVIMSWNRLEARPRTDDFSRALRAEVRDALWFISRQWQFGEFTAEDTGSAMEMRVDMQTSKIQNYSLKGEAAMKYSSEVPMEAMVESEASGPDLTARMEMGKYFEDRLRKGLRSYASNTVEKVINDFKGATSLQFKLPTPRQNYPQIYSNPALVKHLVTIEEGRMIDGEALFHTIINKGNASHIVVSVDSRNLNTKVDELAEEYYMYYSTLYKNPNNKTTSAWNPQQLEHQFHASVPSSSSGFSVLSANEYANGHLDWYSFDFSTEAGGFNKTLVNDRVASENISRKEITLLPADLNYPGMPMPRWWQFEDYKLNIGAVKADTNELPKLLMAEFALIYSNDWMLIPFDVGVGSLCDVKNIVVRDVFGQYTSVSPAGQGKSDDWKRWSMFNLNRIDVSSGAADTRLFVPPAVVRTMESDPIEQVSLIRDEMSNMVWGIESKIPDDLGGSMDGANAARQYYQFLESTANPIINSSDGQVENTAAIDYKLGTTVPENWIPFIPVRKGGVNSRQIQLRRAAMPRIIDGRPAERIRPRTDLLKTGYDEANDKWDPYFLYEEEVPRSGVIVKRSWQRTRLNNGKNHTWLGRRVTNGRGEANSGLEYDLVVDKE